MGTRGAGTSFGNYAGVMRDHWITTLNQEGEWGRLIKGYVGKTRQRVQILLAYASICEHMLPYASLR